EALHDLALVGGVELNDTDIADRSLAGLLLESERQPNGAELDGLSAAALGHAGLRQRLRDAQPLAFQRVGRDDVDFAETRDASGDRGEVVHVAAEADIGKHLSAERFEGFTE